MKKRIMGLLLAGAMVIGASMPVAATDFSSDVSENTGASGRELTFNSQIKDVTIEVEVVKSDKVIVNPYQAEVTYTGVSGGQSTDNMTSTKTLIANPIKFTNKSTVPVVVDLKGQIKLPGDNYTKDTSSEAGGYNYKGMNAKDKVSVAASLDAIKTAATKQVYVKATVAKDEAMSEVLWVGTKATTGAITFAKAADIVYTAAGTAFLANPPILAEKDSTRGGEATTLYVVFTGGASVSPVSAWSETTDKIELITTYDIKRMGESKVVSRFAAGNATADSVKSLQ